MFEDIRFEHTYSRGALTPNRLVDLSTNSQTIISNISPYHTNKGLSSIPNLAGKTEDILDNKYPIYKPYISDMPDMGILRFERFEDIKV